MGSQDEFTCTDSAQLFFCEAENAKGNSIILIHGWGADHRYFDFQLKPLSKFRVIIPELEGLGSTPEPPEYSIHRQAEKVHQLAASLGISQAVIIGHSMGGMIAQEIALSFPDFVQGLILEDTSPGLGNFLMTRIMTYFSHLLCGTTPGIREFLAKRWAISYRNSDGAAGALIAEYAWGSCSKILVKYVKAMRLWNSLPSLNWIRVPTLVIHGEMDRMISIRQAEALSENIPSAELVTIPESGHTPHLERPDLFNEHMTSFLKRIGWQQTINR